MSVSENAPIYLIITLAAAAMLTLAYRNVEQGTFALSVDAQKEAHRRRHVHVEMRRGNLLAVGC